MELHEQLREIKAKFRMAMNGVVSSAMRERGIVYKLNFGVEFLRIREIAHSYAPNHGLAQALWKEDIRECKIMASMVQPVETFYPELAEIWIEQMHVAELAEFTTLNLFRRLPYAIEAAFRWMASDKEMFRLCGFLLMARLFMQHTLLNERAEMEYLDQVAVALHASNSSVRLAAFSSLQKYQQLGLEEEKRAIAIAPQLLG